MEFVLIFQAPSNKAAAEIQICSAGDSRFKAHSLKRGSDDEYSN
jgi:hypothetical protein